MSDTEYGDDTAKKKMWFIRMWGFTFSYIDLRLAVLAGIATGLMIAKLWSPILSVDWYWWFILLVLAVMKPLIAFCKQVSGSAE